MSLDDRHFRELANHLYDGIYAIDRGRRIIYWNRAAEQITGYSKDEVIGSCCRHNVLIHVDQAGTPLCSVEHCPAMATIQNGKIEDAQVYLHHKDGHRLPVATRVLPLRDRQGKVVGALEVFRDVSPLLAAREQIEQLEQLSLLDPLTGIGNRRFLESQLQARFDELKRYGWSFGLLFCDIDRFKRFNDTHGHGVGDDVLKMVAKTMANCVRPFDYVGRWGGDEFMAIIAKVEPWQAYAVAERIRAMVQQSLITTPDGELLRVTISVGAAIAGPTDDQESLLQRVDELLYRDKRGQPNRVVVQDRG